MDNTELGCRCTDPDEDFATLDDTLTTDLAHHSQAARHVYRILWHRGETPTTELVATTVLTRQTIRSALKSLRQADQVESRTDPGDNRRQLHRVAGDARSYAPNMES